jgi:hypothetical protein
VRVSRLWHGLLAVVVGSCLVVQLVLIVGGGPNVNAVTTEDDAGVGERLVRLFSYFTIQSNLLVLAGALTLARDPGRDGRGWRVLRLDMLLGIVVTGVVFATILAPLTHPTGIAFWLNAGFHYFSPWWALAGWLLFGPRPRFDWRTVGLAFVWPALWIAYTFVHGAVTGWYPYPFLDVTEIGYLDALRDTGLVLVVALLLAVALKALDDRLPAWRGHSWVGVRTPSPRE